MDVSETKKGCNNELVIIVWGYQLEQASYRVIFMKSVAFNRTRRL